MFITTDKNLFLRYLLIFIFIFIFITQSFADNSKAIYKGTDCNGPHLDLRIDTVNRARALLKGVRAVSDIGGFFEFYEQSKISGRLRIYRGPWEGSLVQSSSNISTLTGEDLKSGIFYKIEFKQIDSCTIEVSLKFKAPTVSSNIEFNILKLSSDLFKGALLDAEPSSVLDSKLIPVEPKPFFNRVLLRTKNRIIINGDFCDLEITDINKSNSIIVSDTRNVPWDSTKSITVISVKENIIPESIISFKYSIRSISKSKKILNDHLILNSKSSFVLPSEINTWNFFSYPPKISKKTTGRFYFHANDIIFGTPSGIAEKVLVSEIATHASMQLEVNPLPSDKVGRGIFVERVAGGAYSLLPDEGFEIITEGDRIIIRGVGERGCLFGVYALLGRLENVSGSWGVGCGTIRDWPDMPIRGICMEQLPPSIRDVSIAKRYLDAFSQARANTVVFLHNPKQIRAWINGIDDGGWTRGQIAEIVDYARSLQLDIWAGLGSHFNPNDFPNMEIHQNSTFYNPSNDNNYKYIFSLYKEIVDLYNPSTTLIGHDEIKNLSIYANILNKSTEEILAADVIKIHDMLGNWGVRTAMWGDMLLDRNFWRYGPGEANSLNPYYNSGATHLSLPHLPKDITIFDWHYSEESDYPSIGYFHDNGFRVVGSPWFDPEAAKSLAKSVKKYGGAGIIATDWGFLRTLSPAATTLYSLAYAWSGDYKIFQDNADIVVLANILQDNNYSKIPFIQKTAGIANVANKSTVDTGNESGIFNIGSYIDLRSLSPGIQVLSGVRFEIGSANNGDNNNCVVAENNSLLSSKKIVFQGNQDAKFLAFLHTSYIEEPQYNLRNIGRYDIEFENGKIETVNLLENWNITDIRSSEGLRKNSWLFNRSPDILVGSKLAWRGTSSAGIPLNIQMFIWKNPNPELNIRNIRLGVMKTPKNTKIALIGLTFLH